LIAGAGINRRFIVKNKLKLAAAVIALSFPVVPSVHAGDLDILLDRLVEKNVLDPGEAQEIRVETQEEAKKEISTQSHAVLPLWLQAIKLRGDVRARYEFKDNRNNKYNQHRLRYRLRFGADAAVNEKVYASFGFAGGSSADPRSTNQTFTDNFTKKNLYVDYASIEYNLNSSLAFIAGRMKNPLWLTNDMVWDTDINMEGVAARFNKPLNRNWQLFSNAGFMALGESLTVADDPYLTMLQPGVAWRNDGATLDARFGVAGYSFTHVRNRAVMSNRPSTTEGYQVANSTLTNTLYKYDYDAISPEIEVNTDFAPVPVPLLGALGYSVSFAGLFGNYIQSIGHAGDRTGWLAGFRLGQRKVEDAGQWQLRYSFRRLGKDAWMDTYPDSDFFGGSTGVLGHEALLTLGLGKSFSTDLDYYIARPTTGVLKSERVFQFDVNVKF
jgi:hypothetical protein